MDLISALHPLLVNFTGNWKWENKQRKQSNQQVKQTKQKVQTSQANGNIN